MEPADLTQTARMMIERHGLRAQAVAAERASEMQIAGQTAEFARWRSIGEVIAELRRTEALHRNTAQA